MEFKFKCTGDNLDQIPKSIIESTGIRFPELHKNMEDMSRLAQELKAYYRDNICRVPFCTTVEAEGMGALINLGDEKNGPRVSDYIFKSFEDLRSIGKMNLEKGRIKEVLDAVEKLSKHKEVVSLSVEGPITIISSLIEPSIFYKAIRKNREAVDKLMRVIEENIIEYILRGIEKGAKIISYADPAGSLEIVGPKMYKDISGKSTYNILKRVECHLHDAVLHLCGKTSTGLQEVGLISAERMEYHERLTYGEGIMCLVDKSKGRRIIGHNCIKRTPLKLREAILWNIELI